MKTILEYLSTKVAQTKIKATNKTIKQIVKDELKRLGHDADLNHIDVSKVTDMNSLFGCCENDYLGPKYNDLNPDISFWDISNVKIMARMFKSCSNFNCDLSQWDVSNVENMVCMFDECYEFNQDLSQWNVSKVKDMMCMFEHCENFNCDISGWNVSNVEDMQYMFKNCKNFNQDLSKWNVDNVKVKAYMFDDCPIIEEYKPKFK